MRNPEPLDKVLFVALMAMGVYSMALLAMRAFLLSHPMAYALMVGGYTSATIGGANASVGNGMWWLFLAATLVGALKFMPVYWLMGRRWGMEFIEMSLQYMPRARRFFTKALTKESGKTKATILGLLPLGYAPGPVPGNLLNAIAGLLRVGFWPLLALNVLAVLAVNGLFMWLGFTFGDQILEVVEVVNRYLLWITLGLLALMVFQARKKTST
ncbi:hypothetical protein ACFWGD_01880 [Corynebacterium sp. NPDC060344]|uniref:hypothetical protein n=1 Tax=Corynebacterium sp. NPDC060344 TaxID=3347101 RepID=UPI00365E2AC6